MLVGLGGAGESGRDAQADEDRSRDVPLNADEQARASEHSAGGPGCERPPDIENERDRDEDKAEEGDLDRWVHAFRVDELRRKARKKSATLVEDVDYDTLCEHSAQSTVATEPDVGLASA